MVYVYLIYGLSFFLLWAVLWIYHLKLWEVSIGKNIWMIAAFAITHGVSDWIEMVIVMQRLSSPVLQSISLALLIVSFSFLLLFGLATIAGQSTRIQLLPVFLLIAAIVIIGIIGIGSRQLTTGEIFTRYLLGLPGGLLTFYALNERLKIDNTGIAKDFRWTSYGFLGYAILSGFIVPEAGFFPASIFNYRLFESAIGAPVQLFRAISVIVITFGMTRALHLLDVEIERTMRQYQADLEGSVEKRTRDLETINDSLRRNEVQLTAILDNIPDMAWLKDEESKFVRVNEPFARSAGMTIQDLIGKTDLDIWPKGLAEHYRTDDREVMESRRRKQVEEPFVDKDGNPRWIETIKTPIFNERGEVIGTAGIARDVTERKKAVEEIRTEQLFRKAVETSVLAGIVAIDLQKRQMYVNPAFCRMVGWTEQELIGADPPFRYWPPEEIGNIKRAYEETVAGKGQPEGYELRFLRRSGERFDVFVQNSLLMDGAQNVIGWLASVYDITERKKQAQALAESERRYRLLYETMLQGIVYHDSDYKIISVNTAAERILGKSARELIGQTPVSTEHDTIREDGSLFPGPEHPACVALETGQPITGVVMGVFNPEEKEYRWINIDAVPLFRKEEARPYQVYTIFADITERRKIEAALRESEKRYRQLFENMHEGLLIQDLVTDDAGKPVDVRYVEINPALERFIGKTRVEIIGKTRNEVLGVPDPEVVHAISSVVETGAPYHMVRYSAGAKRWYESFSYSVGAGKAATLVLDITKRREAEEALRENEKRLQVIIDTVPALISYIGNDLRYRFVNRQYEQWWNRPASEMVGKHIKDVLGAERYRIIEEQIERALRGERLTYEWTVPRDHEKRNVHVDYVPFIGEDGKLLGFVVQVNDITDQKRIEERLRKGKELSDALNSIDETIHSTRNFDAIADQVVEKAAQAIGAESAVIYMREGETWKVSYAYGLPKSIIRECLSAEEVRYSVIATEEKRTVVVNDVGNDDLMKNCRTVKQFGITALLDVPLIVDKNFVGNFAVHFHNPKMKFTEAEEDFMNKAASSFTLALKNARLFDAQKKVEKRLKEANERLSGVLESIAEAYYAFDRDWRILEINKEAEKILGPAKDLIGKVYWDIFPQNRGSEIERQYRRAVAEKSTIHFEAMSAINNRWYELHAYPRGDRLEVYFTDITARKKIEQELRDLNRDFVVFLENTTDFVYFKDKNSRFRFCSQTVANITGFPSWRDLIGKHDLEIFPKDAAQVYSEEESPVFRTGTPLLNKVDPFYDDQGRKGWVSTNKWPVFDDEGRVAGIFGISRDITEHKKMEEEIRHMAQHDALTGLPNRLLFADILQIERAQARRNRKKIAVLFLDLDRFKEINDTLGHDAGDQLLKEVSTRLTGSIRESDSVARIGGDEFNILLADISNVETVSDVVQKIVDAFQPSFAVAGQELHITTSIGISIYPDDSKSIDTLLRYADIAMYYAKERGRNNFQFYNPDINSRSLEHMRLEGMLRQSINRGELEVYYQPQVDVRSRKIVCAEALVRWKHPEQGLLESKKFIPAAEEIGFITAIDEYVLRAACADIRRWLDAGLTPVCLTVNLSTREFQNPDLTKKIGRILEETGIPARYLTLEITESMAMSNIELTIKRLNELVEMGLHIAIDDFGTGYSSLNHLKRLPVQYLKIDKSFIRDIATDPDDRTIIDAVTAMAHTMKLKVTAEGVETEDQLEFLKGLNCDEAQGYLFSDPLPTERFKELIGAGK